MEQQANAKLSGWRSLLWVPDDNPVRGLTADELITFGNGKKASLICCLYCKSDVWGHPATCPFCLNELPPRG